jgi:hypothetical protein
LLLLCLFLLSTDTVSTREPTDEELRPPTFLSATMARLMRAGADSTMHYLEDRRMPPQAAPLLAAAIRVSQQQAEAAHVHAMPEHVRKALEPFYDADLLKRVRWTLPDSGPGLGSLLAGWYFRKGGAVTFGDVVVVSDRKMANNVWLWAHELTHIEQYRRFGIDGFARAYIDDWRGLEAAANWRADRVTEAIRLKKRCQADASCNALRA